MKFKDQPNHPCNLMKISQLRLVVTNLNPYHDPCQSMNYIGHHIRILVLPEDIVIFGPDISSTIKKDIAKVISRMWNLHKNNTNPLQYLKL